jgi:hypothetical protein
MVEEFAKTFDFEIIEMDANLELIEKCFYNALGSGKEST